jgi:hypothetical protein
MQMSDPKQQLAKELKVSCRDKLKISIFQKLESRNALILSGVQPVIQARDLCNTKLTGRHCHAIKSLINRT